MPHWNSKGEEEWVCQKGAHVCTGPSTWVDRGSLLANLLGCYGNVCTACILKPVAVNVQCIFCGTAHKVLVIAPAYIDWLGGELIQKVMPQLSADDRELLISGTCSKCFPGDD